MKIYDIKGLMIVLLLLVSHFLKNTVFIFCGQRIVTVLNRRITQNIGIASNVSVVGGLPS